MHFIIQKKKKKHTFLQKVYKLSKAKFSHFDRMRGDKNQIFRTLDARGGVLKDQEAEFYNQLAELSESLEFKVADFERFVDTVRETASRHLHTLVLVNADLRGVCIPKFIYYCDTI